MTAILNTHWAANGFSPLYDASYPAGDRPPVDPAVGVADYYLPAALTFVHWSFPNVAHTGIDVDFKLTAYDWHDRAISWAVTSGPAGMMIDADGTLHWTPGSEGTQAVEVTATFDGGSPVVHSFTISVDNARCIFIAPTTATPAGNDTTGTGTLAQPYASLEKASEQFNTGSIGHTVYHRGGTYNKTNWDWSVAPLSAIWFDAWSLADPLMFRNYPGETVTYAIAGGHGFTMYGAGVITYGFTIDGGDGADTSSLIVHEGSAAKRMTVRNHQSAASFNPSGILLACGGLLDQCTAYDNYDRLNPTAGNNSNIIAYADKGSGDAFIIDCLSLGYSQAGYKIKHAGLGKIHVHKSASFGTPEGVLGGDNGSSVRYCTFHDTTDRGSSLHIGSNSLLAGMNEGGMLYDSNTIVKEATTRSVINHESYQLMFDPLYPVRWTNNTIETTVVEDGGVFLSYENQADATGFQAVIDGNSVYTNAPANCVQLGLNTSFDFSKLNDYGSGNALLGVRGTYTIAVAGRSFQIANGILTEL